MIDLTNRESLLSFAEAARLLPPHRGKQVHSSTLYRWAREGAKLPSGRIIKLEALKLGSHYITSVEALNHFGKALLQGDQQAPASVTAQQRAGQWALDELARRRGKKIG